MNEFGWCPHEHLLAFHGEPKSFESEAVATARGTVERFKERLRNEDAMKDTEIPPLTHPTTELLNENALLRRSLVVLTKRVEELESEIDKMRGELVESVPDLERIAHTLKRFYFAEHSLSSLQPIIALCFELNPELVEQKR